MVTAVINGSVGLVAAETAETWGKDRGAATKSESHAGLPPAWLSETGAIYGRAALAERFR